MLAQPADIGQKQTLHEPNYPQVRLCNKRTMSRQQNEILLEIDRFMPSPTGDWRELDMLLSELWQGNVSTACLPVLFRVFERFPKDDGAGVFWNIVHGVESTDLDYEGPLRESLSRQPSDLGQIMLRRLEKSKVPVK